MNYFSFWDNILCFSILPAPVCLEAFQLDLWWCPNTDVDIFVLLGCSSAPSLPRIIIIETCKCIQPITLTVPPIAEKELPLPDPPPLVAKTTQCVSLAPIVSMNSNNHNSEHVNPNPHPRLAYLWHIFMQRMRTFMWCFSSPTCIYCSLECISYIRTRYLWFERSLYDSYIIHSMQTAA